MYHFVSSSELVNKVAHLFCPSSVFFNLNMAHATDSHESIFIRKVFTPLTLVVNVRCSPTTHPASGVG